MKAVVLVTARLKSTRLPRKILSDMMGKPVLVHLLDRIKTATHVQEIVLCTSTHLQDEPLIGLANREQVRCFRGSEEDVLERLAQAAQWVQAEYVVNITADNIFVGPEFIDRAVGRYEQTSEDLITGYQLPIGAYGWGINVEALQEVCAIKDEHDTEVWGDYFTKTGLFRVHDLEFEPPVHRPNLRLTLDYPEDLVVIRTIFDHLYGLGRVFPLREIIAFLDQRPDVVAINQHCQQLYRAHLNASAPMKLKVDLQG